jgi:hypothetical protein
MRFFILDMPGNVLLFRVLRQSTIGAERLDFRVRNGIGYYTLAIITRQELILKLFNNVKFYILSKYRKKDTIVLSSEATIISQFKEEIPIDTDFVDHPLPTIHPFLDYFFQNLLINSKLIFKFLKLI